MVIDATSAAGYSESKLSRDERFHVSCEKIGYPPERVWEALSRSWAIQRARRKAGAPESAPVAPLSDEDRRIVELHADQQPLPPPTAEVIVRTGLLDLPENTHERRAYALELFRSARRKIAAVRDEELSPEEHRAYAAFIAWREMYLGTDEWVQYYEALAREAMPSVLELNNQNFDSALQNYPPATIVYFHGARGQGDGPKRALRVERLAQRIAPHGRVARVNVLANRELWKRFRVAVKPEPLLLFSMSGFLRSMISSDESLEALENWARPYLTDLKRFRPELREWFEAQRSQSSPAPDRGEEVRSADSVS